MKSANVQMKINDIKQQLREAQVALKEARDNAERLVSNTRLAAVERLSRENPTYRICGEGIHALLAVVQLKNKYAPRPVYTGPDGDEFDHMDPSPNPEAQELLGPLFKTAEESISLCRAKRQDLLDATLRDTMPEIMGKASAEVEKAQKRIEQLQEQLQQAQKDLKWACDDLQIPGYVVDRINKALQEKLSAYMYAPEDEISVDTQDRLTLYGSAIITTSTVIRLDEFCESLSEIDRLDPDEQLDQLIGDIENIVNEDPWIKSSKHRLVPMVLCTSFETEYDGERQHHSAYYEADTGYGEPEGDFYVGPVSAETKVSLQILMANDD